MPRMGLTREDVEGAIAALERLGQATTNDAVLKQLGRGSKTTVNKWMREIRAERERIEAAEAELPESIARIVRSASAEIWQEARILARSEFDAQHLQDRMSLEQAEAQTQELEAEFCELQDAMQAMEGERDGAVGQLAEVRQQLETARVNLARYEERLSAADRLLAAVEERARLAETQAAVQAKRAERAEQMLQRVGAREPAAEKPEAERA